MANRIKHIALQTENPAETAEWYKTVFGLDELRRSPADTGEEGVWLTDGYIYFAILKMGSEDAPNLGEGSSTVKGVHHIGFYVDDHDEAVSTVEENGVTYYQFDSVFFEEVEDEDGQTFYEVVGSPDGSDQEIEN